MICLRFIVMSIIASEGCWTGRYLMFPSGGQVYPEGACVHSRKWANRGRGRGDARSGGGGCPATAVLVLPVAVIGPLPPGPAGWAPPRRPPAAGPGPDAYRPG